MTQQTCHIPDQIINGRKFDAATCSWEPVVVDCPAPKGDAEILAMLDEMKALHIKKSNDYGSDEDALANVRAAADIGMSAATGAWVRAKDKVFRIDRHFKGNRLVNESVQDSLMDLASYCLITLKFLREEKASSE